MIQTLQSAMLPKYNIARRSNERHWQIVGCRREDLNPQPTDYKSVALPVELQRHDTYEKFMVARDGIEPPTRGFSVLCSTD